MIEHADISVIIPTFRRPALLAQALESLLVPSPLSLEVMVIDDSPDGEGEAAVQACNDSRVHYERWPNPTGGRPALLRNAAARKARGAVLYFLDDDDVVLMDGVAAAFGQLQDSACGVFVSVPETFGAQPAKVASERAYWAPAKALFAQCPSAADLAARLVFRDAVLTTSSCMLKRAAFQGSGGFDEQLAVSEDLDFYARAIAHCGYVYGAQPIVRRRVGQPSLIAQTQREQLDRAYAQMRAAYRMRHGLPNYVKYRLLYRLIAWRDRLANRLGSA